MNLVLMKFLAFLHALNYRINQKGQGEYQVSNHHMINYQEVKKKIFFNEENALIWR